MKPKVNLVFFGTPAFSIPSFQACIDFAQVSAVVTQPDRPRGRGQHLSPSDVKQLALKNGIQVFNPERLGEKGGSEAEEAYAKIKSLQPDIFVVTAYGNLLPKRFLEIPKWGCFNVHASLLPRWRGAAPIQRALEAGDKVTGVCLQKMVSDLDAGDIFESIHQPLGDEDDSKTLMNSLSMLGYNLVKSLVEHIADKSGEIALTPQNPELVTFASKISKEEGYWNSSWTSQQTFNKVRAFVAWPGVKIFAPELNLEISLEKCRLWDTNKLKQLPTHVRTGEICLVGDKAILFSLDSKPHALELLKIKIPGKAEINAFDYFQNEFKKRNIGSIKVLGPLKPALT